MRKASKKFIALVLVFLMVWCYSGTVIFAGDDHGNGFSTASQIQIRRNIDGVIETSGDVDYFKFTTGSAGIYTIGTNGATDTYGYLYDSNTSNTLLDQNDNGDSGSSNFSITKALLANHTYYIAVQHYNIDTGTGFYNLRVEFSDLVVQLSNAQNQVAVTNTIYPKFRVYNKGSSTINLSNIKLRYYYTTDYHVGQNCVVDWVSVDTSYITSSIVKMSSPVNGADCYVEFGFTNGTISPGGNLVIMPRVYHTDWSNYYQQGDYSFEATATDFVNSFRVTAYNSGNLIWGREPADIVATPTPIQIVTPTPTPIPTITPTPKPSTIVTPTPVPTVLPTQVSNIYQAEDATIYKGVIETLYTGYTGSAYVNYDYGTDSYVEWVVNVSTSGTKTLKFRYANGGTTDRPMAISVNGNVVNNNLSFGSTGVWNTWGESSMNATLNAGINIIKAISANPNGGPNVDCLEIVGSTVPPTPVPTTVLEYEAENLSSTVSGATVQTSIEAEYSGGKGVVFNGDGNGDYIQFTLPNVPAGNYLVKYTYKAFYNRGINQLSIDGVNQGAPVDQYSSVSKFSSEAVLGTKNFSTSGNKLFRFTVTGKNGSSANYLITVDKIILIPQQHLVSYKFDETSGITAADSSGNGKTATLVGNPKWVSGYINNALDLSGSNQYASLPEGIVSTLNDFTISTWVKLDTLGNWSRIFDFGTGTTACMFLATKTHLNTLRFNITNGSEGDQSIDASGPLAIGSWQHVVVTLSGNVGTLYVNGIKVGENNNITLNPSDLGNTNLNYIGKSQYSADSYLDGAIDDFNIYSYALSSNDIKNNYLSGLPSKSSNIIEVENSGLTGGAFFNNAAYVYSGYGYAEAIGKVGAASEILFKVPSTGNYDFRIRYANSSGNTSSLTVYANDTKIQKIYFKNMPTWDYFGDSFVTLPLVAGANKISFVYEPDDLGSVNLDYMSYTPSLSSSASTNLALSKAITFSCGGNTSPELANDGVSSDASRFTRLGGSGTQWMQIDLGQAYNVNRIKLWHYFGDSPQYPRIFRDVIIQLSNDPTFKSGVSTVFNTDKNNDAGQGEGQDSEYIEDKNGKEIVFDTIKARYVRLWSSGSNLSSSNIYTEVQVMSNEGGYWKADEGLGTVLKDAYSNNNITLGTSSMAPKWEVNGKFGKAIRFDGNNDYININKKDIPYPWTASFWVKREDTANPGAVLLASPNYELMLEQYGGGRKIGFTDVIRNKNYYFNYSIPITSGIQSNWVNLTMVGTSAGVSLYIDGEFIGANPNPIFCPMSTIGSSTNSLKGVLDEIRVFDRELSQMQISEIAAKGLPVPVIENPYDGKELVKGSVTADRDISRVLLKQDVTLNYNFSGDNVSFTSKPKDIILIFDESGSMGTDLRGQINYNVEEKRITIAKQAASQFVEKFRGTNTNIGMISIENYTNTIFSPVSMLSLNADGTAVNEAALQNHINKLKPKDHTNIGDAMRVAYWMLKDSPNDKYVVLMTDGVSTSYSLNSANTSEYEMGPGIIDKDLERWYKSGFDPDGRNMLYATTFGKLLSGIGVKSHIIGFSVNDEECELLENIAISSNADMVEDNSKHFYRAKSANELYEIYMKISGEIIDTINIGSALFTQTFPEGVSVTSVPSGFTITEKNGIYTVTGTINDLKLKLNSLSIDSRDYQLDTSSIPPLDIKIKYNTAGLKNFEGFKIAYNDPEGIPREYIGNNLSTLGEVIEITLDKDKAILPIGKTMRIKVTSVSPEYAPQTVNWVSSDETVAIVTPIPSSMNGCWEAEVTSTGKEGTVDISAVSTYDSMFEEKCNVIIWVIDIS